MILLVAVAGVSGLLFGSFLNVVIARVPAGESVVSPASRCPRCGGAIGPRDNVPVVSWLLLHGRSRCCGLPISRRYPLVEAGSAMALAAVTAWMLHRSGTAGWPLGDNSAPSPAWLLAWVALAWFTLAGIALALIDIDVKRLPTVIVVPSWWIGAALLGGAALLAGNRPAAVRMLLGGVGLWLLYRLLHQVYPAGMAYGDVRLAGLIGGYLAWVGWGALAVGAFAGFLFGALGGVVLMAVHGGGLKRKIPYGPYMLAGTWVGLIWGEQLAHAYLRLTGLG
ncbi:MAG: prepilin peptidase [Kineosporiaceae bacterium]|nr:prepilin peptidase [Kineosporiaceae bacterium]